MTKDDIFSKTLKENENERFEKQLKCKNYLQSCYEIKDILNLANKIGKLKIEYAKTNDEKYLEEIKKTKKDIAKEFKKNNLDIKKIIPDYSCKICNDKGFLTNGEVCSCLKRKYLQNLLKYSKTDLTNFPLLNEIDVSIYADDKNKIKLIYNILNIQKTKFNTILFSGETGTGKTYIAKSFLKTLILQNNLGLFYDSINVNQIFLNAHLNFNERESILSELKNCDILLIDDFGNETKYNNITKEYYLELLNLRQSNNKITIFTTNLTLKDIQQNYNERFFSRLVDKELSLKYSFTGADLRLN